MAKVLLVEDDRNLAGTVREWLEFEHYLVEWVETGTDALDMMKSYKYDVIIMDLTLPKMDGIEVCKNYRQLGGETPILILTGRGTVPDKELGFDAGADDYLTKPFHLKELSARIRALMRRPKDFAGEVLKAGNIALRHRGTYCNQRRQRYTFTPNGICFAGIFDATSRAGF